MAIRPSGQALPANLMISDGAGRMPSSSIPLFKPSLAMQFGSQQSSFRMPSSDIPRFTPKLDNTIAWSTAIGDLCVEAGGDKVGDAIRINHCNAGKSQLWNFLPSSPAGKTLLQLHDTSKCIHVSDKEGVLNGSPIDLQECEETPSELWQLEDALPVPTNQNQGLPLASETRQMMMFLLALAGTGVLSLGAWFWRQPKARMVTASQAPSTWGTSNMVLTARSEGGVAMTTSLEPSVATRRGGNVSMTATVENSGGSGGVIGLEEMDTHGSVMTLSRYMIEQAQANPDLQAMESLMTGIQMACKQIASLVSRAGIQDLTGLEGDGGSVNVQGEEQKKLDVISNNVMKNCLRFSGKVGVVGSEEEDDPVLIEDSFDGRYTAVFDPLDGSSNIDAAISTGTIFGIFEDTGDEDCIIPDDEKLTEKQVECLIQTLRPGTKLRAAGYCMYSSSTVFVLTMGNGTHGFTLDPTIGEFVLTHPNIKIPKRGKIYSINESNTPEWPAALQEYINNLKTGKGESGVKYSSRYIGSMVGDIHRTLLYGGIFGYPGDDVNPNGKLRLLYEGAPMSFIVEQAGGKCYTGSQRIMDIVPSSVHQRVPCFLGSPEDVDEVLGYYKKADIAKNYVY
jgi:fructose-1,6-bisphosphatase I